MEDDELVRTLRAAGCVFAEEEAAELRAGVTPADLLAAVARRVAGEPLEQVLGRAGFGAVQVHTAPGVFVPRRRTLLLARLTVALAPPGAVVVDLCCGTGALGAAVRAQRPDVELHAADLDPDAVACARRNLPPARVHEGDLYAALPATLRGAVDVVVANAPYVPTGSIGVMPPEARDHEHRLALDGGPDGLDVHRRVAAGAPDWLAPDGALVLETSTRQADASAGLLRAAGLDVQVERDDDVDGTAVVGRRRRRRGWGPC